MLAGAHEHPLELRHHLRGGRLGGAPAHQFLEQPRVAEAPAREHHRGDAGARKRLTDALRVVQAAGEDHGRRQRVGQARGERVVGDALVVHRGGARVEGDRSDPRVRHQAVGEFEAGGVPGALAGAELYGDRHSSPTPPLRSPRFGRPLDSGAGDGDGAGGISEQGSAGAGLADLGHGTAHVEVDRVGPRGDHSSGGGAHHGRILPEELDRGRRGEAGGASTVLEPRGALLGVDAQQLAQRAFVAVVHRVARDHLRDRHPRPVALGLQAHEPVADPRQWGEQHAVGDPQGAELPGVGQVGVGMSSWPPRYGGPTVSDPESSARSSDPICCRAHWTAAVAQLSAVLRATAHTSSSS